MVARFRALYGAGPMHLLAFVASALVAGAAVAGWFDNTSSITIRILIWFIGLIVAHDLIFLPLYSLADRIALRAAPAPQAHLPRDRARGWVYVRVPAMLSGLLFLVFFPEILRLGDQTFHTASGLHQNVYMARFLLTCGALFALSGVCYVVSLARAPAALPDQRADLSGVTQPERGGGRVEADVVGQRQEPRGQPLEGRQRADHLGALG